MLIKSRVVLTSAVALLALSACNSKDADKTAAAGASASPAAVAATVNGTAISQKQVEMILKQQASQGMPDNAESRKMIIDNLAMQLIVAQEAAKKGLDKTPDVADQLEMIKQSVLADAYVQDYMKTNTVTDEMLTAEYDKIKAQAAGNQYKARHILVEKEADAKDIIAKLKKDPKAFDALAKAKSKDPGSKDKGGDLGWFDPRGMVPEFGAAVAKLEKDKFTEEPVKSQFGYHVIMLEDTRANPIPTLEQVKPRLTQQVQQQNMKKMLDDMKAKAKIEITAAPAVAAPASATAATPAAAPAAATEAAKK
ncbi:peptidylprolyl isomerase [Undibacterium sp.]|uniref:foldase protein PrsA n=1 Tax=Undibacterium sp. TaxID=1914977 RepID=UPI0025F025B1|nr:peptidylprolyl isomerase [Undibacterium sp.]